MTLMISIVLVALLIVLESDPHSDLKWTLLKIVVVVEVQLVQLAVAPITPSSFRSTHALLDFPEVVVICLAVDDLVELVLSSV